ncbi:MAG TPA: hypothetical protein VF389_06575 [Woeseiaceae bacterium]
MSSKPIIFARAAVPLKGLFQRGAIGAKKIPALGRENQGENLRQKKGNAMVLLQARPAKKFHGTFLQVEILGQRSLDVGNVGVFVHRPVQFNDATEFVAASIPGISQSKLGVVLDRHVQKITRPLPAGL